MGRMSIRRMKALKFSTKQASPVSTKRNLKQTSNVKSIYKPIEVIKMKKYSCFEKPYKLGD